MKWGGGELSDRMSEGGEEEEEEEGAGDGPPPSEGEGDSELEDRTQVKEPEKQWRKQRREQREREEDQGYDAREQWQMQAVCSVSALLTHNQVECSGESGRI